MSFVSSSLRPVAAWDWQRHGVCRGRVDSVFYPPEGERPSARWRREKAAKALCVRCPVRPECAACALGTGERHGTWGGFTEGERARLRRLGWEDTANRYRTRVDVVKLEARLRRTGRRREPRTGPVR
jgi:WhiB family redox-sensing transcriptional regulator